MAIMVDLNQGWRMAGDVSPSLDVDGARRPILGSDEVRLLSLPIGSLSEAERVEIESHVMHSYRFLAHIPWTREIRHIPAGN